MLCLLAWLCAKQAKATFCTDSRCLRPTNRVRDASFACSFSCSAPNNTTHVFRNDDVAFSGFSAVAVDDRSCRKPRTQRHDLPQIPTNRGLPAAALFVEIILPVFLKHEEWGDMCGSLYLLIY